MLASLTPNCREDSLINTAIPSVNLAFLARGGEMGALMRAHDWAETPLGSLDDWPQSPLTSLKPSASRMSPNQRFPTRCSAYGFHIRTAGSLGLRGYRPIHLCERVWLDAAGQARCRHFPHSLRLGEQALRVAASALLGRDPCPSSPA